MYHIDIRDRGRESQTVGVAYLQGVLHEHQTILKSTVYEPICRVYVLKFLLREDL